MAIDRKKIVSACEPVKYEPADVTAIQKCLDGTALPHEMQRAFKWVIEFAAGTYDQSYRPGVEGQRDTDFAEGRRFVGNSIIKLSRLNASRLVRRELDEA